MAFYSAFPLSSFSQVFTKLVCHARDGKGIHSVCFVPRWTSSSRRAGGLRFPLTEKQHASISRFGENDRYRFWSIFHHEGSGSLLPGGVVKAPNVGARWWQTCENPEFHRYAFRGCPYQRGWGHEWADDRAESLITRVVQNWDGNYIGWQKPRWCKSCTLRVCFLEVGEGSYYGRCRGTTVRTYGLALLCTYTIVSFPESW